MSVEIQEGGDYAYSPLHDPITQFRLLRLLGDSTASQIAGELQTYAIEDCPQYEAVSYCWGDPNASEVVILDGQPMFVNASCRYALWQARAQPTENRLFWIDSICINQKDLAEKTAQVQRMGAIYHNAAQVLACLGHDDDDSTFLFRTLSQLEPEVVVLSALNTSIRTEIEDDLQRRIINWMLSLDHDFARFATALKALSRRPFFSRMWIYQEMFLASEVRMLCGVKSVSMFALKDIEAVCSTLIAHFRPMQEYDYKEAQIQLLNLLSEHELFWGEDRYLVSEHPSGLGNLPIFIHRLHRGKRALQKLNFAGPLGIVEELKHNRPLKCYDPRDKIYGILSAFKDCNIIPDYTITAFGLALRVLREYASSVDASYGVALADVLGVNLLLSHDTPEFTDAMKNFGVFEGQQSDLISNRIGDTSSLQQSNPWACQILSDDSGHLTAPFKGPMMSHPDGSDSASNVGNHASNSTLQTPRYIIANGQEVAVVSGVTAPGDWIVPLAHYTTSYYSFFCLGLILREELNGVYRIVGEVAFSPKYQPCISWENCACQFGPDFHNDHATGFSITFDCEELLLLSIRLQQPFAAMRRDSPADKVGEATLPTGPTPFWRKSFGSRFESTEPLVTPYKPRQRGQRAESQF